MKIKVVIPNSGMSRGTLNARELNLFVGFAMPELTALQKCMSFPVRFRNAAEAAPAIVSHLAG